jgi:hypothetical protein
MKVRGGLQTELIRVLRVELGDVVDVFSHGGRGECRLLLQFLSLCQHPHRGCA